MTLKDSCGRNRHLFTLLLFGSLFLVADASADEPSHAWSFAETQLLLKESCIDCHNADDAAGEVDLEKLSDAGVLSTERSVWTRVYKQLKVGAMPPEEKLDEATRAKAVQWLDKHLRSPLERPFRRSVSAGCSFPTVW